MLFENLNRVVVDYDARAGALAPYDVQSELLFLVLCWWPYPDWPPPEQFGRPWSMSSLLAGGNYRLRFETAMLGSRRCLILEKPGSDALWLDASAPHCLLRREVYNPETGAVQWRCDYEGHTHHGGNLWLPRTFTNQHFDSYAPSKEGQARLVVDAQCAITDLRVNDEVTGADFQLQLPPGTVRRQVRNGIEDFLPLQSGQRDHWKAIMGWAAKTVASQGRRPTPPHRDYLLVAAWSFVGVLTGIALRRASGFLWKKIRIPNRASRVYKLIQGIPSRRH
jgi:hypothetical protein